MSYITFPYGLHVHGLSFSLNKFFAHFCILEAKLQIKSLKNNNTTCYAQKLNTSVCDLITNPYYSDTCERSYANSRMKARCEGALKSKPIPSQSSSRHFMSYLSNCLFQGQSSSERSS